ncbi:hypothetical protein [Allonocardiopsis opalescens]|uniref:Uncharacterized protein n=1 Tax=Allonocardiopsis opalescens TaxID=1144618 RepID=A0A2T0PTI9_9ACTN|nr:hypothetical protein [Allonocardiopsis opalescens]PRX92036.1 hypothetical protein CLV72_112109 [Allonocardiopsis opalescens]
MAKTTITLPDDVVMQRAREIADQSEQSLEIFVHRAVRAAILSDEAAQIAAAGGFDPVEDALLAEEDAEAMERDYEEAARRQGTV